MVENGLSVLGVKKYNKPQTLIPFRAVKVLLWAARPFTPLNMSYLFGFECEKSGDGTPVPWSCRIVPLLTPPETMKARYEHDTRFELTNTGYKLWLTPEVNPFPVNLGWQILDGGGGVVHEGRAPLKTPIAPGETRVVRAPFTAPGSAGRYTVRWDLIREGDFWFADNGGHPVTSRITVEG